MASKRPKKSWSDGDTVKFRDNSDDLQEGKITILSTQVYIEAANGRHIFQSHADFKREQLK